MKTIRIATRRSKLALWQAHFIRDQLLSAHAELSVEIIGMTTKGDTWLQAPLSEIGGKGLFVKELESAMLAGAADIAVHSMKDLPAQLPDGFELPVIAYRAAVNDVLVSPIGELMDLPDRARVGSSSLRRQAQLLARRADLQMLPIRGNVDTRLGKLANGEYDAIVLAQAGIDRLQLDVPGVSVLSVQDSLPAPGQGALGIECLTDSPVMAYLEALNDPDVSLCVRAERGISLGLGADCSLPVAALASFVAADDASQVGEMKLDAMIASVDGREILRAQAYGRDPDLLASRVLEALHAQGADRLLRQLRH